ncbi:MAG TPA: penicillin-binding transpeptidase domain-containing protein [Bacillota bacterium]|nr:penicillin-binding transpeptidase domain-containing protein [Bacillota bacterium]
MFKKLKNIFNKKAKSKKEKTNPVVKIFYNRTALLLAVIVIFLFAILIRTSILMLGDSHASTVSLTTGNVTEISLAAPRGDIVAADGTLIATSEKSTSLWLVQPDLSTAQLNSQLLDISNLLAKYEISSESSLGKYFGPPETDNSTETEEISFVFKQSADKISIWQQDKDLFNMVLPENAKTKREQSRLVQEDPGEFFTWLLYDYFEIEDRAAGSSRLYSDREAYRIMELRYLILENNWLWTKRTPIRLAKNVNEIIAAEIEGQNQRYLGVLSTAEWNRVYTPYASLMPHVLGYVGRINSNQYDVLASQGYSSSDIIGQTGVESSAERYLRGQDGLQTFDKWTGENGESYYYPGAYSVVPTSGNKTILTIRPDLQQVAQEALQKNIEDLREGVLSGTEYDAPEGAVVVYNVKTGAILAMVSLPDYNPDDFLMQSVDSGAAAKVQSYLQDDEGKPLLNRAISENYAPGSTFKVVTSIAGLETGTITASDNNYTCLGYEEIAQIWWRCFTAPVHGHGSIPLTKAIEESCNLYFFKLGIDTGIDNISAWAKKLGYGEISGIDLPGETSGIRPSRELKRLLRTDPGDKQWFPADTAQTAIGQFDNSYTTLQMVRGLAGIISGTLQTPHVTADIIAEDGSIVREEQIVSEDLGLKQEHINLIRQGMYASTQKSKGYTSQLFRDFPVRVGVKTGTAEEGYRSSGYKINSVFTCFAPLDDPEIAIAHVVRDASYGDLSAEISYRILCEYYGIEPKEIVYDSSSAN